MPPLSSLVLALVEKNGEGNQYLTSSLFLFGNDPGAYDVVVTNPDGGEGRLGAGFNVTSACGAGSGSAVLMLGLALGLLSLAGSFKVRRKRR